MIVNTTSPIIAATMIIAATTIVATFFPLMNLMYSVWKSLGTEDRILKRRTREIPLPTPLSVICSPIHIRSAEPAVIAITAIAISAIFLPVLASAKPIRSP